MPVPIFQALVGDLRTGQINARVPLTGFSLQQMLNAAGSITGAAVNMSDAGAAALDLYHTAAPAKTFLGIQYDRTILNAGPIWVHDYVRSGASATLTMGAAGLPSLWDHRVVMALLAEPLVVGAAQASSTSYPTGANKSLGDIAMALCAQALTHVGGNLPIVFPSAQGMTPGATRTYNGYDLSNLGAMLTELEGVLNGPEIRWPARYQAANPNAIEWVMQVGTPAQPLLVQGGADWYFDASVPKSMVGDISMNVDGTSFGTRAWEVGSGSQAGVLLSQADSTVLTAAGYPLLEVVDRSHSGDGSQADLDAYAAGYLAQTNRPSTLWKIKVRNDGDGTGPRLDQYVAGDYCQVIVGSDPYLPPGAHRARILQINSDYGFESTLTLATLLAEV